MKVRLKFLWLCLLILPAMQNADITYNSGNASLTQDVRLFSTQRANFTLATNFNGTNNNFEGNGYIFTLPSVNTTAVILLDTSAVAGEVIMTDIILENFSPAHVNLNFTGSGNGNGKFSFGKNCLVRMLKDESLTYAIRFYNGAVMDGQGKMLTLGDNGQLLGDSFTLKNMTIFIDQPTSASSTTSINGINASGVITFDNVRVICKHDWNLNLGVPAFINQNFVSGTGNFVFSPSTGPGSNLNKVTFNHGLNVDFRPNTTGSEKGFLSMTNMNNKIVFDGIVLTLNNKGMQLTYGTVEFSRLSKLFSASVSTTTGFSLGDGTTAHDLQLIFAPDAILNVENGTLRYEMG